ncbi:MAG: 2-dehydropantoate 2-reductase [Candidatus Bathyarchaeia archaeon]
MTFNKIFILGAGAIGSVIGALLSKKNDVTLIGNEAHVDAVRSKGLLVSSNINETFRLEADAQIREIPQRTLIFLTTKAYDSEKAVEGISRLLRKDTVILVLQNGLENEEIVKRAVGHKAKVLRGITSMAAEFFQAGEVKYWTGETAIERDGVGEEIAAVMNNSGLETRVSKNINNETWRKIVLNSVINPLTAIFRVRNREIFTQPLAEVRHQIIRECVQVGNAEGVTFPKDLEKEIGKEIISYANYSSMCQDIMRGKRTEIDFLNGRIVELGARHHILTPVNETLVHLIKFLEEKREFPRED